MAARVCWNCRVTIPRDGPDSLCAHCRTHPRPHHESVTFNRPEWFGDYVELLSVLADMKLPLEMLSDTPAVKPLLASYDGAVAVKQRARDYRRRKHDRQGT